MNILITNIKINCFIWTVNINICVLRKDIIFFISRYSNTSGFVLDIIHRFYILRRSTAASTCYPYIELQQTIAVTAKFKFFLIIISDSINKAWNSGVWFDTYEILKYSDFFQYLPHFIRPIRTIYTNNISTYFFKDTRTDFRRMPHKSHVILFISHIAYDRQIYSLLVRKISNPHLFQIGESFKVNDIRISACIYLVFEKIISRFIC